MDRVIGVIGSNGDLGKQLVHALNEADFNVLQYDESMKNSGRILKEIKAGAAVIHLTIPGVALSEYGQFSKEFEGITVLHDSVMHTSNMANEAHFDGSASVVHMLMNNKNKVIIAQGTPNESKVAEHFSQFGMDPVIMHPGEHDQIMAMSQAPLALLCEMIHAPLQQYLEAGLLTPSGKELADALSARAANWTPSTIESLLQNPYLHKLVRDMRDTLNQASLSFTYDSGIRGLLMRMGIVEIPDDEASAQVMFNKTNRNRLRWAIETEPDETKRAEIAKYAREKYQLPGDDVM